MMPRRISQMRATLQSLYPSSHTLNHFVHEHNLWLRTHLRDLKLYASDSGAVHSDFSKQPPRPESAELRFWQQVSLLVAQMDGMRAGYNVAQGIQNAMSEDEALLFQADGDAPGLSTRKSDMLVKNMSGVAVGSPAAYIFTIFLFVYTVFGFHGFTTTKDDSNLESTAEFIDKLASEGYWFDDALWCTHPLF